MSNIQQEIEEIVNRETRAWDTQDVELLMTIFHPDMVWPWPRTEFSHDPVDWVLELGRYDYERWRAGWQQLFDTHRLVHNKREIIKIKISREDDGAFAVVDIDTLWTATWLLTAERSTRRYRAFVKTESVGRCGFAAPWRKAFLLSVRLLML